MVYLHTCYSCKDGKHEYCEGTITPKRPDNVPVFGGSKCVCTCRQKKKPENEEELNK